MGQLKTPSESSLQYLGLQVAMDNALGVDVMDAGEQLLPNAGRLRFSEVLLLANTLQQLASSQQFRDDVSVCLRKR